VCVCACVRVSVYLSIDWVNLRGTHLGIYTILPMLILYGVWHTKRGVGRASYIAQWRYNGIAIVRAMQVGGANERMIESCTKASKYNNIL